DYNHDDRISITVAFVKSPSDSFTDAYIESVKTSKLDRFKFIDVSQQEEHHSLVVDHHSQSIKDHVDALMETHMPLLKDFVTDISSSRSRSDLETFTGLVFDLLFVPLVDISHQFNIPSYIFLTANIAGFLSLLFHLTTQHDETRNSPDFKRSYPDELISGFINPVPFNVLPSALFDKDNELEPYAISGFSDRGSPPVYPVGPVLDINCKPYTELDLAQCKKDMLPEGFMERIQGKGIMIHGWAPQVKILAHEAIGGFVSHCGWNSILESLWFGVPVVTWPMYAEQQLNAFKMVKELGLAIELRLDYEELNVSNVVTANEIKNAVKQVMDDSSEVRKKTKEMAEIARKAIVNGGSPFLSIQRFIEDM
ncbi:hypothetical protein Goarm_001527, partial [Gossypium armourianum]|nr:hypothetical protein [Gossypium armourianum]